MTTTPEEKRPNSTAYGFGSTSTEPIASAGSVSVDRPVVGIGQAARAHLDAGLIRAVRL